MPDVARLPPPPDGALHARFYTWERYRPITRVCNRDHQPNAFNPSAVGGRFRPIYCGHTEPVPTLYGSNRAEGALGETVFHDIPVGEGDWTIARASLYPKLLTVLIPQRPLALVDLTGWAHKTLKIDGRALVDCAPAEYAITARWAERFHDLEETPDGIMWRSRQYDRTYAVMLFGDRVEPGDLHVVLDDTRPLWMGEGLDEVRAAAEAASVMIAIG